MIRTPKRAACAVLIGFALLLPGAALASTPPPSSSPCWKQVINDWYSGSIPTTYPVSCYRDAIKNLSTVNVLYSSAHDDIARAMQIAIVKSSPSGTTTTTVTAVKTKNGPAVVKVSSSSGPPPSQADSITATSSGVTSFPLPLLILGGLAILLVAAGGIGLLIRRFQSPPPPDAA